MIAHVVDGVRANVGGEGTLKIIRESIRCPQVLRAEFTTNLRVLSGYLVICFLTIKEYLGRDTVLFFSDGGT